MPRPKDQTKVRAIFKAALTVVLNSGYVHLKMSEVAKEAGVATGTLYTYFKDKNGLINALFRDLKRSKMKAVFQGYDPEAPFYEGFKVLWMNYLQAGLQEPARNLFIDQYKNSEYLDEASQILSDNYYVPFYNYLDQAKEQGFIRDVPTRLMTAHLLGGANEIAKLYFGKDEKISKTDVDKCFEMAWNSIKKTKIN